MRIQQFNIISDLFPTAIANGVGFKTFYIQVEEAYGKTLNDKLWIPFVQKVVYHLRRARNNGDISQQDQRIDNMEISNRNDTHDNHVQHQTTPLKTIFTPS